MLSQVLAAFRIDYRARLGANSVPQPSGSVTVWDEADVVAVRLIRHEQATFGCLSPHL